MWQKIKHFLFVWDGIWSIPVALIMYVAFGFAGEKLWGADFGAMSPSFFHSAFFAALIIVFLNFSAWLGMWFNFREVFRYYIQNSSGDFNSLTPKQKICVVLVIYAFYFAAGLLVVVSVV